MTVDDLLDAIGEIDDAYLETAREKPIRRKIMWTGFGSLAACFLLVLFIPYGILHTLHLKNSAEVDYTSKDYTRFSVYYVNGEILFSSVYEIHGGYEEMFFAWKNQNSIGQEVLLKNLDLLHSDPEDDLGDSADIGYILRITVSSSLTDYLNEDTNGLLSESLKKTVASYAGVRIDDIELIFVE